jgi:hypothetical protein
MWNEVDGELVHTESGYVFERGDLSRAAYKHMCSWIRKNFDTQLSLKENWGRAESSWDSLSHNEQMYLWSIHTQEVQQAEDTCTLLLDIVKKSRAVDYIKKMFENAVRGVVERV